MLSIREPDARTLDFKNHTQSTTYNPGGCRHFVKIDKIVFAINTTAAAGHM